MSKDVVQRPHAKINAADYGSRPSPGRLGWVGASPRPHVHATKTPARRARSGVFSLVHPHSEKYSAFSEIEIGCISITVSSHLKGRIAIVTSAGRDAVDASGASDESACSLRTAKPCGPDASRLASSRWTFRRRRRQQRPISGERGISRNPLRAGMPGDFRCDRCEYSCAFFATLAHTRLRCIWAPGIPARPSSADHLQQLGRHAPREANACPRGLIET